MYNLPEIVTEAGNCYFCHKDVGAGNYCYGCLEYVCENCDFTGPSGAHEVEDHEWAEDDDDEEEEEN